MGVKKKTRYQRDKRASNSGDTKDHGADTDGNQPDPASRIFQIVAMIPKGKVASYGQIAKLAGMPRHARLVGSTLSNLPKGSKLPWHRVVNASLKISNPNHPALQRKRLEREGVEFVGERVVRSQRWDTA